MNGNVGAGILNIITESLYDKPIVVFREYVQNSVDSFKKLELEVKSDELSSKIWIEGNNLYFLDNGKGISKNEFFDKMIKIAGSEKKKTENIGYKGIGRLSGLSYCEKLVFMNICSYKNDSLQKYYIDGKKYKQIKHQLNDCDFDDLMKQIGTYNEIVAGDELVKIKLLLSSYKQIFTKQDTGFLVILEDISNVLKQTIENKEDFYKELGWLLPVKFKDELLESDVKELFEDITAPLPKTNTIPAKAYNISFNNEVVERPISLNMLRDYTCKTNLKYALGFHSFYRDRINVTKGKGNDFSGIKLYLDNILLCDENELIPILVKNGYVRHTINELIQSVRGMGSIIYITDKINISANARRTFIEITDEDAVDFLKLLAEFVTNVYDARYALSKYNTGINAVEQNQEKLEQLRASANAALQKLARDEITIEVEDNAPMGFDDLDDTEKRQLIKKKLTKDMNMRIKEYLLQTSAFDYDNVTLDFITWLSSNKNYK
jgi:molecular chaperone HtpG